MMTFSLQANYLLLLLLARPKRLAANLKIHLILLRDGDDVDGIGDFRL